MVETPLTVEVRGMDCQACVNKVTTALRSIKGVLRAEVSLENTMATIWFEDAGQVREDRIRKAVTKAGYLVGEIQALGS